MEASKPLARKMWGTAERKSVPESPRSFRCTVDHIALSPLQRHCDAQKARSHGRPCHVDDESVGTVYGKFATVDLCYLVLIRVCINVLNLGLLLT